MLTVSAVSIGAIASWQLTRTLVANSVSIDNGHAPVPNIAALSGGFNVMLVGEDNAPGQHGWGSARQSTQNDVDIVVHVAADHRSGVVLSIPRDLVIDHPQCEDPTTKQVFPPMLQQPLNTAFMRGGLGCVVATTSRLTGLTIPYAALFSFSSTVAMADAVGGVPVCVTKAIDDPYSGLKLPAGRSVITGRTALAYLRSRHGVGDGSDLARISSQQAYMSSLMRKMTSSSTLTSPTRLYTLAATAAHTVTLSTSLASIDTMVSMLLAVKDIPTNRFVFVQYPTRPDPANLNKVVPDPYLAPLLLKRISTDQPVRLDHAASGYSTTVVKAPAHHAATSTPTPSPTSTARQPAALSGLNGQTAAQQTCSVAFHG
ncbi:MAG: LytR family transcriptional regulator [Acidobacteria bacterium]|nr:LytR family transcriptional regulator [Acidobacteriota bacterium]